MSIVRTRTRSTMQKACVINVTIKWVEQSQQQIALTKMKSTSQKENVSDAINLTTSRKSLMKNKLKGNEKSYMLGLIIYTNLIMLGFNKYRLPFQNLFILYFEIKQNE